MRRYLDYWRWDWSSVKRLLKASGFSLCLRFGRDFLAVYSVVFSALSRLAKVDRVRGFTVGSAQR